MKISFGGGKEGGAESWEGLCLIFSLHNMKERKKEKKRFQAPPSSSLPPQKKLFFSSFYVKLFLNWKEKKNFVVLMYHVCKEKNIQKIKKFFIKKGRVFVPSYGV